MRSALVGLSMIAAACGGNGVTPGELGGHCYPNGTCNVTLSCSGGICVASVADADTNATVDAASDALVDTVPDAHVLRVDAASDATLDAPRDAYCEDLNTNGAPDGHHNPGQNCIAAGCHSETNPGAGAPPFSYAGTLYTDATGATSKAGATVFFNLSGIEKKVLTASNGNFFITPGVGGLEAPTNASTATTRASGCPNNAVMVGALAQGGGNCNNCHKIGGTTSPIHLP